MSNYNKPQLVPFERAGLTEIGYTLMPDVGSVSARVSLTVGVNGVSDLGGGWYRVPALVNRTFSGFIMFDSVETPEADKAYDSAEPSVEQQLEPIAEDVSAIRARLAEVEPDEAIPLEVLPVSTSPDKRRVYIDLGELCDEQVEQIGGVTIEGQLVLPKPFAVTTIGDEYFLNGWKFEKTTDASGNTIGRTFFDLPLTTAMSVAGAEFKFKIKDGKLLGQKPLPAGPSQFLHKL